MKLEPKPELVSLVIAMSMGAVLIVIALILLVLYWKDWVVKPKRRKRWRKVIMRDFVDRVNTTISTKYPVVIYNIVTWIHSQGERYYVVSDEKFMEAFNSKMQEEIAKYSRSQEEKFEARVNTAYYEYQSRNRKNTE